MSNFYHHERDERKTTWIGPRPGYPDLDKSLWDLMRSYLKDRQLDYKLAHANGWYPTSVLDRYPRLVIPCSNSLGVPYFQARDMSGKATLRYRSPAASRDDSIAIIWPQERASGTVVVEGPMDALAAGELDHVGIAVMGNDPPEDVLDLIVTIAKPFEPILIIPDLDHLEMSAISAYLAARGLRTEVRLISGGKDLAELNPKRRKQVINAVS